MELIGVVVAVDACDWLQISNGCVPILSLMFNSRLMAIEVGLEFEPADRLRGMFGDAALEAVLDGSMALAYAVMLLLSPCQVVDIVTGLKVDDVVGKSNAIRPSCSAADVVADGALLPIASCEVLPPAVSYI